MYISLTDYQLHCSCKVIANKFHVYSTGSDATDHILVDDNPAYMTMKRIHMNKNSAYETVTQLPSSANSHARTFYKHIISILHVCQQP